MDRFADIRPFTPEELPAVYDRLLANPQFRALVEYFYPHVPLEAVAKKMHGCKTSLEFQKAFAYDVVTGLLKKLSTGWEMDDAQVDCHRNYTFMSNHRDIVLDSAILDVMLVDHGFATTCEIAIGDNLLGLPWVKDLARLNKSFIVRRGLPMREMLLASKQLSEYIHFAIGQKHENVWIAQRAGRAKDSDDRTADGVLKMLAMGGEGSVAQRLRQLHIVPLAISYEYDPCDFLKAQEFQARRDNPNWKKGPTDDLVSMRTGILGFKGHVHYHCAPCMDEWLDSLPAGMPKADLFHAVCDHIDGEIHRNYRLYPANYVAWDELEGGEAHADHYTGAEKAAFDKYLAGQLGKVTLERPDTAFLKERMLVMYANPAINRERAVAAAMR